MRLDQYLHQNNHAESRERARALVMAGIVYVDGIKADKAGTAVKNGAVIEVRGGDHPYVSRGGLKLEKALQVFSVSPVNKICMDVGASTGGFTDCLLQNGAKKVYAVDVGYGQLAWKIRCDERVIPLERTNIRKIDLSLVPDIIDLFTIDVSFISLNIVIPTLNAFTSNTCEGICLVKPQFEAGKEKVGKKGVVRSAETHVEVLNKVTDYAHMSGYSVIDIDYSPITGPEGNMEFLMYIKKDAQQSRQGSGQIEKLVERAHLSMRKE